MLSSPLPLIVISPNNNLKDNAPAMNNNSSANSNTASLEYKTKTLSNRVGCLRNEIQEVESKIQRLLKEREERTKKAADLCNSGIFHNNNNSINKGAIDSSLINKQQHKTPGSDDSAWKRLGGEVSDLKNHATCTVLGRDRAVGPIDYPSSHNHNNSHSSLNNFVFSLEQCDHQHKQTVDDLTIRIYYQNKKTVDFSHRMFGGNALEVPKYAQPCEAPGFQINRKRYIDFKSKLVESISRRRKTLNEADETAASEYDCSYSQWINKIQSQKNSAKRRAKDAKNREFFEKIFPDLKKRREQDERIARMGTRGSGKSEFEIEEIASSLRQQELTESEMHRNAVIPPLMISRGGSTAPPTYIDNNRFIKDPVALYNQSQNISSWTPQRQKLFRDKYLMHPKNFAAVASAVGKSIEECVKFYYLKKPTENYKKQLRNNSIKKRTGKLKVTRTSTPQPDNSRPNTPNAAASLSSTYNSLLITSMNSSSFSTNTTAAMTSQPTSLVSEDSCSCDCTNTTYVTTTSSPLLSNPSINTTSVSEPLATASVASNIGSTQSHPNHDDPLRGSQGNSVNPNSGGISPSRTGLNSGTNIVDESPGRIPGQKSKESNLSLLSVESDKHIEKENKALATSQDKVYHQVSNNSFINANESLFSRVVSSAQLGLAEKSSVFTVVSVNNSDLWCAPALSKSSMASARADGGKDNSGGRLLQQLQLQGSPVQMSKSPYREHGGSANSNCGDIIGSTSSLKGPTKGLVSVTRNTSISAAANTSSANHILCSKDASSGGCVTNTNLSHASGGLGPGSGSMANSGMSIAGATVAARLATAKDARADMQSTFQQNKPSPMQQSTTASLAIAMGIESQLPEHSSSSNVAGIPGLGLGIGSSGIVGCGSNTGGSGIAGSTKDITAATLLQNDKSCTISSKINKNCCPVPFCKSKHSKQRKLKSLHHRWEILTQEQKEILKSELGITETITKACANCYNHVTNILDPENGIEFSPGTSLNLEDGTSWTLEEEQTLQCVLKSHGCDWERLAAAIPSKTDKQLKNFYLFNRHKYDHLVREWSKCTVASRRNRIGSHSNGGSRTGSGGTPSGSRNCEPGAGNGGSDDTDYLTDDAGENQDSTYINIDQVHSNVPAAASSQSQQAAAQQMKSHILRRYQTEDQCAGATNTAANGGGPTSAASLTSAASFMATGGCATGANGGTLGGGTSPGGSCKRSLLSPSACIERMKEVRDEGHSPTTPNPPHRSIVTSPSIFASNQQGGAPSDCSHFMNMNTMSISEIINQGINNQVSAEDLDLRGTPIMKLFSGRGGAGVAATSAVSANLLQRHFNADNLNLSSNAVSNSGGNNSAAHPSSLVNRSNSGGGGNSNTSAQKTSALDVMKSHIKHNLNLSNSTGASPSASASELHKQQQMMLASNMQNKNCASGYKGSLSAGASDGSENKSMGSTKTAAEKTSPISPTPLNNSRPNSKNAAGVPPAPPPLLHLPSTIMAAHQESSQRKSPLVNNVDKFQHLANSYSAATAGAGGATASGGSISQGIPMNYPILPDLASEQAVAVAAAAAVASRQQVPGLLQLNGLNHNGNAAAALEYFRLNRERGLTDAPRSSATSIKAAAAPNNSELLAADYVTSQTMEAAQKNKMRNSPNNHASVPNASVRRPEQPIVGGAPNNSSGALAAANAAALQNLPPQALLDPQTTAYLLQNQPLLQQQLQQLCYLPPSTTKQLFVPPPPAPANHHPLANWQLLTAPGASAAGVSPWPYPPGTVPAPPPPPTTNSSLRPPNPHGFHQGLAAYPNGSTAAAAADYARLLAASPQNAAQNPLLELNPVVRKLLDIHNNEQQLYKLYPALSKDLSLNLEALYNIQHANGTPVSSQEVAAINQLAAAQSKSLDANLYKAISISSSGAAAPPNGSSEREKSAAASAAAAAIQQSLHTQASNHLRRPPPPELPSNPNAAPGALPPSSTVKSNALLNSIDHALGSSGSSKGSGEVRIVPPVSKVPKLSPTDIRAHDRSMAAVNNTFLENNNNGNGGGGSMGSDHSQRKRAASPSSRLVSAIPNKRINGMSSDQNLGGDRDRDRELYQQHSASTGAGVPTPGSGSSGSSSKLLSSSRTAATSSNLSSSKSGANNNSSISEQSSTPILSSSAVPATGTNSSTSAAASSGSVGAAPFADSNGKGVTGPGGGNTNTGSSGSSYQMQKRFSDNYCPKYYRPQPMLKQSSKKEDYNTSSNSSSAGSGSGVGGNAGGGVADRTSPCDSNSIATSSSSSNTGSNNSGSSTSSNISSSTSFPSSAGPKNKQLISSSHSNHTLQQQQHQMKENGYLSLSNHSHSHNTSERSTKDGNTSSPCSSSSSSKDIKNNLSLTSTSQGGNSSGGGAAGSGSSTGGTASSGSGGAAVTSAAGGNSKLTNHNPATNKSKNNSSSTTSSTLSHEVAKT